MQAVLSDHSGEHCACSFTFGKYDALHHVCLEALLRGNTPCARAGNETCASCGIIHLVGGGCNTMATAASPQ